jgi:cell pole-organizing protein PopZ
MEEILASIRRIIADDNDTKSPAAEPSAMQAAAVSPQASASPPQPSLAPLRPAATTASPPPMAQDEIDALMGPNDAAAEKAGVLDLTEAMATDAPPSEGFRTIDGQPDVVFDDGSAESEPPPLREPQRERYAHPALDRPLVSGATSAAVDSAFKALAQTVLVQNARTLEDLVREMLRPMLKTWLDDNLPGLVERLVRAEIERVSRGR